MADEPIYITALSSISPLGASLKEAWKNYRNKRHFLKEKAVGGTTAWMATLATGKEREILDLKDSDSKYRDLDPTVLYAIYASREAVRQANWKDGNFGVNIGSSRGATALFENYYAEFIHSGQASTLSSPTTTLGNISSWVAHDLRSQGPEISHSITCSTALHSLLNGVAWLRSGMADKFLVGGSEAPLTPFTIAQMRALKIYSRVQGGEDGGYPCRALDLGKNQNSMVLGEAASMACLEKGKVAGPLAQIVGLGYATEVLEHNISISTDAQCFQRSMRMALGGRDPKEVDVIVMHAPGTIKGDRSEVGAIKKVFGDRIPALTTNKWKLGHTFGASGMLNVEFAVLMLLHQEFIGVPFVELPSVPDKIDLVMVNAVGFGGNAVSVLLGKV
ncbi:MAG TPA: beta-ketoacyl synthase N-terminal-like domain-containing protein [Arenibacter sp.]|nr:beta-ketoacyl synthase N-terminal-like domain-containing protein [Arenibacter sp.]